MRVEYEATLDDVSEPMIRHYLRGRTYARQRFKEPVWGGVGGTAAGYFISAMSGNKEWLGWVCPVTFMIGYMLVFITMRATVSKRIRAYVKSEVGDRLPVKTHFEVSGNYLHCESLKGSLSFSLQTLTGIAEDDERLEISFGDAGLCTIPLRVFRDAEQKAEFLSEVHRARQEDLSSI